MSTLPARSLVLDSEGIADLRLIAGRRDGKHDAFQRMLTRAEFSHETFGKALGVSRPAITSWTNGTRWPRDADMRKALITCGIPKSILIQEWTATRADDIQTVERIQSELEFTFDPVERLCAIADCLEEEVFIRQGFKAKEDTRAADLFFTRADYYREVHRKNNTSNVRDVSPAQASWSKGSAVYDQSVTDSQASVNTPSSDPIQQASALASIGKLVT